MTGTNKSGKNEFALVVGICLTAFGIYFLLDRVFPNFWPNISSTIHAVFNFAWPIAIIAAGVLVIVSARKGTLSTPAGKRLYRSKTNKKIAGICGGLAEFFAIDAVYVRIIAIVLLFVSFFTIVLLYFIFWFVIPEESDTYTTPRV